LTVRPPLSAVTVSRYQLTTSSSSHFLPITFLVFLFCSRAPCPKVCGAWERAANRSKHHQPAFAYCEPCSEPVCNPRRITRTTSSPSSSSLIIFLCSQLLFASTKNTSQRVETSHRLLIEKAIVNQELAWAVQSPANLAFIFFSHQNKREEEKEKSPATIHTQRRTTTKCAAENSTSMHSFSELPFFSSWRDGHRQQRQHSPL
jgi:hypothetical protein